MCQGYFRVSKEDGRERSCNGSKTSDRERVSIQTVSGTKKGRANETCHKLEAFKQVPGLSPLQDGEYPGGTRHLSSQRLDDKNRPQGRLFLNSHPSVSQEVFEVQVGKENVPIHMPAFRPGLGSKNIYKGSSSGGWLLEGYRDQMCDLSDSRPSNNFPRFCYRFQIQDIEFPTREGSCTEAAGESNVEKEASVSSCPYSADREDVCSPPSSSFSSPSLPQPAAPEAQSSQETRLRYANQHFIENLSGPTLVVTKPLYREQSTGEGSTSKFNHRDGCFEERLGSIVSRCDDRQLLEQGGGKPLYQCPGDDGCFLCNPGLHQAFAGCKDTSTHRHHISCCSHKSHGRNKVSPANCISEGALVLVPASEDNHNSTTPSRSGECHSRLSIQMHIRQDRLDVGSQHLSLHRQFDGPTASRSICDLFYQATAPLLQLEAGSGGGRNRCFHAGLVECPRICSSSVVSNLEGVGKGTDGEGNSGVDYPTVANPSLAPYLNRNDSRLPHHSSKAGDSGPLTKLHGDGLISSSSVGRLEGLTQAETQIRRNFRESY